jgi:lysozyme
MVVCALALGGLTLAVAGVSGQNPNNPKGVDVSYWQGTINWTTVKNGGINFTIIRAGHGDSTDTGLTSTGVDTKFASNWAGAKAAGIVRGAYWFVIPSASPSLSGHATALAQKFVNTVMPKQGDLPLAIDFESNANGLTKAQMNTWMQACVAEITRLTHRLPLIYCSPSFGRTTCPARPRTWAARCGSPIGTPTPRRSRPRGPVPGTRFGSMGSRRAPAPPKTQYRPSRALAAKSTWTRSTAA